MTSLSEVAGPVITRCVRKGLDTLSWATYGDSGLDYKASKEALTPK